MISLGINAFLVNYKNIKCYIHRTYSQGSPTLVPAPGSKTEMFRNTLVLKKGIRMCKLPK